MKKETKMQIVIILILVIVLGVLLFFIFKNSNNDSTSIPNMEQNRMIGSSEAVDTKGATEVTDTQTLNGKYETSDSDTAAIRVTDGGDLTLDGATINKEGGDSSNTESSDFYGGNAGVLTEANSTTTIKNSKIITNAKGGNAVFATR